MGAGEMTGGRRTGKRLRQTPRQEQEAREKDPETRMMRQEVESSREQD